MKWIPICMLILWPEDGILHTTWQLDIALFKLKVQMTQTNVDSFSLLTCVLCMLWGRGEEGSHSSYCLSWCCGPGSAAVVLLLLLCHPQQDDGDERVIIFGFPCLKSRRIWSDLLLSDPLTPPARQVPTVHGPELNCYNCNNTVTL